MAAITDELIYDGLDDLREYLETNIDLADAVDISTDSTMDYLLTELHANKGTVILIDFITTPIERKSNNSPYPIILKPSVAINIFSSVEFNETANRKLATKMALQVLRYLNGAKTDHFGKMLIQSPSNLEPIAIYDGTGNKIFWALRLDFSGTVRIDTNEITIGDL